MIKEILFKENIDSSSQILTTHPINIIVGPNNSGKSLLLKELKSLYLGIDLITDSIQTKIIEKIEHQKITIDKVNKLLDTPTIKQNPRQIDISYRDFSNTYTVYVDRQNIIDYVNGIYDNDSIQGFIIYFLYKPSTVFLDTISRLSSMDKQAIADQQNPEILGNESIHKIAKSENLFKILQMYLFDAFKLYLEIAITGEKFSFVFSREPFPEEKRLSYRQESLELYNASFDSEQTSDGRKAYLGILLEILANESSTIFIDEPEVFLHPPLAKKLGNLMSKLSSTNQKQIFASTHSSNFIMGCIESKVPINIIRLTYTNGKTKVNILKNETIKSLMLNPLLRSTNILDSIFYKYAIVTEADSDRAFYQEINNRLLDYLPEWGIEECIFLHTKNKQSIPYIVESLRSMGIKTAAIVDFDIIKDGGDVFTKYLESVNIPKPFYSSIRDQKTKIKNAFPHEEMKITNSKIKTEGINYLRKTDKNIADLACKMINDLAEYGLFIVPVGELESWLPHIPISGHGDKWLVSKFKAMGHDPNSEYYVKPEKDDVWLFISKIKSWLENKNKGFS